MTRPLKCPMRVALADPNGGLAYLAMGLFSYGPDHNFDPPFGFVHRNPPRCKSLTFKENWMSENVHGDAADV
jgi:hypothetical protein